MRTDTEILERMETVKENDSLGFQRSDLINFLSFEAAKPFLKDGVTEEEWKKVMQSKERDAVLKTIKGYMSFAWDKANNYRGLSAGRSINHFISWIWMIDEEFCKVIEDEYENNYQYYGKDILQKICEHFGIDHKGWDNGERVNQEPLE